MQPNSHFSKYTFYYFSFQDSSKNRTKIKAEHYGRLLFISYSELKWCGVCESVVDINTLRKPSGQSWAGILQ